MLNLPINYRDKAKEDIDAIFMCVLTKSQSKAIAENYIRRLTECCKKLGNMPYGGRARDDLLPGLRLFPFERKAIIAYRVTGDAVQIINIFFGGRDYEALYKQDEE